MEMKETSKGIEKSKENIIKVEKSSEKMLEMINNVADQTILGGKSKRLICSIFFSLMVPVILPFPLREKERVWKTAAQMRNLSSGDW